ncbi:MAG: DUF4387 domain-containing protein [Hyphomicrobiaceae bacterium TMED74]|nr:acyl-CoA synthetase [Filomicrobium sp.]RPG36535.1 MAG: DUF4387 domain-containing protein [Hyphomicrobiaceae bacterium TMED74]
MATLAELTNVLRSKNAGALLVTLDLMFEDDATYERVRDSGVLTDTLIADLYSVSQNEVSIIPYDVAKAIKITVPRLVPSGSFGDTDIYGAQQHAPLLNIEIPD